MTNPHPITPPPELLRLWVQQAKRLAPHDPFAWPDYVATKAVCWGADRELEACVEWVRTTNIIGLEGHETLRAARRPKPPSLKEQALRELGDVYDDEKIDDHAYDTIRRALEALPND